MGLDPHTDIIEFEADLHSNELESNLKWHHCPDKHKITVLGIIKQFWDVFCQEGMRQNIQGFFFRLDTSDAKPVWCREPWYGHHESKVITSLVKN